MNYKTTRITLNTLGDLLTSIEAKQKEVENANKYNLKNVIPELRIDVQKLIDEKQDLEFEFRELVLKLRS